MYTYALFVNSRSTNNMMMSRYILHTLLRTENKMSGNAHEFKVEMPIQRCSNLLSVCLLDISICFSDT